jgi:hypothetical protein
MAIPMDVIYFLASYIAIIVIGYVFLNWLSASFLAKFIKIKAGRGRYVMVKVHSKFRTYVVKGWLEGQDLLYNDAESIANKQKTHKRLTIPGTQKDGEDFRSYFYRFAGVWACDVDESTNNIIKRDGSILQGYDAIRWNNIYIRALMKPAAEEKKSIILFVIAGVCVLALVLTIVVIVRIGKVEAAISALSTIKQAAITGGNVV